MSKEFDKVLEGKKESKKDAPNYWKMKDDQIKEIIENRALPYDLESFDRKTAITALQISDIYLGHAKEALEETEDGEVVKTMRQQGYVKVRFHNTSDNDIPYIFIGLNSKAYYIPKEQDIWIPRVLLDSVIKDAIEYRAQTKKVNGKMVQVTRPFQRFPYTMLNY